MSNIWVNPLFPPFASYRHPLIRALAISLNGHGCDWDSSRFYCQIHQVDQAGQRVGDPCTLAVAVAGDLLNVRAQTGMDAINIVRPLEWWTVENVTVIAALMQGPLRPAYELLDDALVLMRHPGGEG
jgi:hypothetical protein